MDRVHRSFVNDDNPLAYQAFQQRQLRPLNDLHAGKIIFEDVNFTYLSFFGLDINKTLLLLEIVFDTAM
jgi:hypothetical protein